MGMRDAISTGNSVEFTGVTHTLKVNGIFFMCLQDFILMKLLGKEGLEERFPCGIMTL